MQTVLNVTRFIAHKLLLLLLALVATGFVFMFALSQTVTKPETIKSWLSEANTYEAGLKAVLELFNEGEGPNQQSAADTLENNKAINEAELAAAIASAVDPEYLQGQVEGGIDGLYGWLEGETPPPQFKITLAGRKDEVVDSLTAAITKQLADQPPCTSAAAIRTDDLLKVNCRIPRAYVKKTVKEFVHNDLPKQIELFSSKGFSDKSLNLDQETLTSVPQTFSMFSWLPWLLLLVSFITAGAVMLTSKGFDRGLREAGYSLLSLGGITLVGTLILNKISTLVPVWQPGGEVSGSGEATFANEVFQPLMQVIVRDVASATRVACIILMVMGGFALAGGWWWRKNIVAKQTKAPVVKSKA